MKKFIKLTLIMSAFTLLISACSATKSVVNGGASRSRFVGTWSVSNVTYEGIIQNAVQSVFDQAPPAAFVGSTWKLTNSGNGIYTLNSGASQTIFWSVNGDAGSQSFQFKKIYQGDKAKNVAEGYQLVVGYNDGATMRLKVPVDVGGGTGYVVYTFVKQ